MKFYANFRTISPVDGPCNNRGQGAEEVDSEREGVGEGILAWDPYNWKATLETRYTSALRPVTIIKTTDYVRLVMRQIE